MTRTVRCPVEDPSAQTPADAVTGCGAVFDTLLDWEGFADCPHCGLYFQPDHPNSQPQPGAPDERQGL